MLSEHSLQPAAPTTSTKRSGKNRQWLAIVGGLVIAVMLVPARARAQGGPPLMTDDPDTPGPGYWEINLAMLLEKSRAERRIGAPLADINYGVGNRIQLKFEIPWLSVGKTGGRFQSGPGDSVFGVKWRFLGEEGRKLAWSIYPQLEVNTGSAMAANGLVDQGRQFLLPTEVTFETGPIEINGEVGRPFASEGDNGWIYGLSTEYTLHRGLELLAEMHGERSGPEPAELLINIGGRQKLTEQILLLIAVGSAVRGLPEERTHLRLYAGVQFNLPGQYVFERRRTDGRWSKTRLQNR